MSVLGVSDVVSIVAVVLGFLGILLATMQFYFSRRGTRYDIDHQRVELEMMRKSIESRMYELNEKLMATQMRWKDVNHLLVASQDRQQDFTAKSQRIQLSPFLKSSGVTQEDIDGDSRLVFVLTPFHPNFRSSFETIAEVCRGLDLNAMRGDEESIQGEVFSHILRLIVRSRFVIANIDGRNPNVLYELGLAHGLGKQTILVAKRPEDVPFDVRAKKLVLYNGRTDLRLKLSEEITRSVLASGEA